MNKMPDHITDGPQTPEDVIDDYFEDEDEAYEQWKQDQIDNNHQKRMDYFNDAFDDWFNSTVGPEQVTRHLSSMHIIRAAFFAGASFGADELTRSIKKTVEKNDE